MNNSHGCAVPNCHVEEIYGIKVHSHAADVRHEHIACQQGVNCNGPGCVRETGKTRKDAR